MSVKGGNMLRKILIFVGLCLTPVSVAQADCMQQCIVDYVVCRESADTPKAKELCDYYLTTCEALCRATPPVDPLTVLPFPSEFGAN
jgi:hypothetical protein